MLKKMSVGQQKTSALNFMVDSRAIRCKGMNYFLKMLISVVI